MLWNKDTDFFVFCYHLWGTCVYEYRQVLSGLCYWCTTACTVRNFIFQLDSQFCASSWKIKLHITKIHGQQYIKISDLVPDNYCFWNESPPASQQKWQSCNCSTPSPFLMPFCFNDPGQFTPLLNLHPCIFTSALFGWFISTYLSHFVLVE
jgi:hypothetical protein